jgi:hypothetical protein
MMQEKSVSKKPGINVEFAPLAEHLLSPPALPSAQARRSRESGFPLPAHKKTVG